MRRRLIFIIVGIVLSGSAAKGQTLEGTWVGYIETGFIGSRDTYGLVFTRGREDTVYNVVGVCYQAQDSKIDTTVSKLKGWMVKKRLLHLEESSVVKATFDTTTNCYLVMELEFTHTKRADILSGKCWGKNNCFTGTIYLKRKTDD
jgi:hypothetical protein